MPSPRDIKAGGAFVELFVKSTRFQRGLRNAQRRLSAFGASVTGLGRRMLLLGGAFVAPFILAARQFAKTGDELDKMSQRVGVSVEFLSELSFAAEISGTSLATLEKGLASMRTVAFDTTGALTKTKTAFDLLETSVFDANGEMKDAETLFQETIIELSAMENQMERNALATKIFGRAGKELGPLLNSGARLGPAPGKKNEIRQDLPQRHRGTEEQIIS